MFSRAISSIKSGFQTITVAPFAAAAAKFSRKGVRAVAPHVGVAGPIAKVAAETVAASMYTQAGEKTKGSLFGVSEKENSEEKAHSFAAHAVASGVAISSRAATYYVANIVLGAATGGASLPVSIAATCAAEYASQKAHSSSADWVDNGGFGKTIAYAYGSYDAYQKGYFSAPNKETLEYAEKYNTAEEQLDGDFVLLPTPAISI